MRTITGDVILPPNAPINTASFVLIDIRDVTLADAPSVVIAQQRLNDVAVRPGGQISFQCQVPEVDQNRSLALRVHISFDGSAQPKPGDLLSTRRYTVPNRGGQSSINVPVTVI